MGRQIRTPDRSGSAVRARRGLGSRRRPSTQTRQRRPFGARWISLILSLALIGLGVFIFTNPMFYVTRAEIGGVRYIPAEEVFTQSGIAGFHILWIDPEVVSRRVEQSPSVTSAEVIVQWPARVVIVVREREPAMVWEQPPARYWVDVNGNLMVMRRELPDLVRVINEGESIPFFCPGPACGDQDTVSIDPMVVRGAQQLKTLRSNIEVLYYDPVRGLSVQDGRGWRGYFGIGTDMDHKLSVYETLVSEIESRGVRPVYIDVSNPDAPFYRVGE